jgi:hypothetical protein
MLALFLFLLGSPPSPAGGAERYLYVDRINGDDTANGLSALKRHGNGPFRTINAAIAAAQPGDTILLAPSREPYREPAVFINKSGEPGKPIVLDGQGAFICGSDHIDPASWRETEPGLFVNDTLYSMIDQGHNASPDVVNAVMARFFMLIDGKQQRMNRTSKGPSVDFKSPGDLQPGEWTFDAPTRAIYLKLEPGDRIADHVIQAPLRANGVTFIGKSAHLVVRNVTAQHTYNDGFNLNDSTRDVLLENIQALDCGDDGISAHANCRVIVRGFVSRGNSTGFCHTDDSQSITENALVFDCHGVEIHLLNSGRHLVKNSRIICDAELPMLNVGGPADNDICQVYMQNVTFIAGASPTKAFRLGGGSVLAAWDCIIEGITFAPGGGEVHLANTTIDGTVTQDASRPAFTADKLANFESQLMQSIATPDNAP